LIKSDQVWDLKRAEMMKERQWGMPWKEFFKLLLASIGVLMLFVVIVAGGTIVVESLESYERRLEEMEAQK